MKKILFLLILGTSSFTYGSYLSHRASLGANRISEAEEKVQGEKRPILGPIRRNLNARSTEAAQEKIDEKTQKLVSVQERANWFRGAGIVLFVAGLGCFIFKKFF